MGKRSDFERVEKDFYRTIDPRAPQALMPHLQDFSKFVEPCAGAGDLIDAFPGQSCIRAFDLSPQSELVEQRDAMSYEPWVYEGADYIITNPPWSRPILHRMILVFSSILPTWLLFDADWAHTKQSAPFMEHCRAIVSVGRLLWIPGTTMSGKDNCAWYLFDQSTKGPTIFYPRASG